MVTEVVTVLANVMPAAQICLDSWGIDLNNANFAFGVVKPAGKGKLVDESLGPTCSRLFGCQAMLQSHVGTCCLHLVMSASTVLHQ